MSNPFCSDDPFAAKADQNGDVWTLAAAEQKQALVPVDNDDALRALRAGVAELMAALAEAQAEAARLRRLNEQLEAALAAAAGVQQARLPDEQKVEDLSPARGATLYPARIPGEATVRSFPCYERGETSPPRILCSKTRRADGARGDERARRCFVPIQG